MDDSLLVSLRQYRPREGRDSLEDFVTEIFCWILRNSLESRSAVLAAINEAMTPENRLPIPEDEAVWETQVNFPGARLDMVATWEGATLIFEHKVHAVLTDRQITRYRQVANDAFGEVKSCVVAIVAHPGQYSAEADACLCWSHVYESLQQVVEESTDTAESFHIASFLALLRHEGLQPAAPVDHQSIAVYPIARNLPSQLHQVLSPLAEREWPLPSEYQAKMCGVRWGRVGLELTPGNRATRWCPGIFIGSVLLGDDHRISHRNTHDMMLHVIVDFDRPLHKHYPLMSEYRDLIDSLRRQVDGTQWEVYHHRDDRPFNAYHPLYVVTPLLELLRGTETMERQREALFEAGCEVLAMMQEGGRLGALTDACEAAISKRN